MHEYQPLVEEPFVITHLFVGHDICHIPTFAAGLKDKIVPIKTVTYIAA